MRHVWFLVAATLLLAGCETLSGVERVSDLRIDLRGKQVSFILNRDVTIPARRARIFLQNGEIVGSRDLYQPVCIFEIDAVDHQGFSVVSENFDVVRIQRSTVQIASRRNIQLASTLTASSSLRKGSESRVHDGYHFWLESDSQPSVMRLTCYGVFDRISRVKTPTLDEIGMALGDIGFLQVQ
jgi:hypothetical protein